MPETRVPARIPSSFVGEPLPKQVLDSAVDPVEITAQTFDQERRGFDQRQVREYLKAVAASLHDAQQRESEMRTRLGRAVRRAEAAEQAMRDMPSADPAELNRQVGEDVTSVLDAARVTAEQRVAAAETSAKKTMASAKARAKDEAQAARDHAGAEAAAMLSTAADRVEHVRGECDALIAEAEEARAQILEDMERRRRQARAQVERLRVGRDRLLRSYDVVRRTLEETTVELKSSLHEAKVRGDGAARAVSAAPLASRLELETELLDAKMIGRVQISKPDPDPDTALRSPALPRRIDIPKAPAPPKAPAVAPELTATTPDPIAVMIEASEAKKDAAAIDLDAEQEPLDEELAQLEDDNLNIVEPADDIEEVHAVPAAPGLFAALRAETDAESSETESTATSEQIPGIEAQRDAVIADAAKQLEKRLKRALADEQNELLAGIRAAKKRSVELTTIVGDVDSHVNRYVIAINEVAAVTYGAGAALIDAQALDGHLPAGAVEELLAADVVLPIRARLESLDGMQVEAADMHVDPVRAFYRQRKTDHLGFAASRLANLLCVAGLCDALPAESDLPWSVAAK